MDDDAFELVRIRGQLVRVRRGAGPDELEEALEQREIRAAESSAMAAALPATFDPSDPRPLVWCTAWQDRAARSLARHLGLRPLLVIYFDEPTAGDGHWKWPAIEAFVGDRPFAWIDDEVGQADLARAGRRSALTLLVRIGGVARARRLARTAAGGLRRDGAHGWPTRRVDAEARPA